MLVLSRKRNESIVINDNIIITVVDIRGDKVRLGFDAPKEVPIHRREVYDAIHRSEALEDSPKKTDQTIFSLDEIKVRDPFVSPLYCVVHKIGTINI